MTPTTCMNKILIVAAVRVHHARTRARRFMIGLLLMPVVMGASRRARSSARKDATDSKDRTFAVVDYTGVRRASR